jgi:site-specific DNA-methyltransferase (adenine-specific)
LGNRRAEHAFYWGSTQWNLPTEETYTDLLQLPLSNGWEPEPYEALRQEYEALRQEYEEMRRPFRNEAHRLFDVWDFSQESHITKEYKHPTQKPPKLIRALIDICTREGGLVVAPFGGSGVDGEQAILAGRRFIGYEIDTEHFQTCCNRLEAAKKNKAIADAQQSLFQPEEIRAAMVQKSLFE